MSLELPIMQDLHEIENVTDVVGCFLIRLQDNAILESTLPLRIPDEILWEIPILKETFQQFSDGLSHGLLKELMLEGDKGFIFIYLIGTDFILLTLGTHQINLPYMKLGMIDILKRINISVENNKSNLLNMPGKEFAMVGEERLTQAQKEIITQTKKDFYRFKPQVVANTEQVPTELASIEQNPVEQAVKQVQTVEITPEKEIKSVPILPSVSLLDLIKGLNKKSDSEKIVDLIQIFDKLQSDLSTYNGIKLADYLDQLKDELLGFSKSSIVIFDISRNARNIRKNPNPISINDQNMINERINHWKQRLTS